MLRKGTHLWIHQIVKIELEELLATAANRITPVGSAAALRTGYQSQRNTNKDWVVVGEIAEV